MARDLFDVVFKEIDEALGSYKEAVSTGRPTSFDDYRFMCGKIVGLQTLRNRVQELQQSLEESDE